MNLSSRWSELQIQAKEMDVLKSLNTFCKIVIWVICQQVPKAGMALVKTFWIIGLATDISPIPPAKKVLSRNISGELLQIR